VTDGPTTTTAIPAGVHPEGGRRGAPPADPAAPAVDAAAPACATRCTPRPWTGAGAVRAMRAVKAALDPLGITDPGTVVPD
jgi:hypothetical protein